MKKIKILLVHPNQPQINEFIKIILKDKILMKKINFYKWPSIKGFFYKKINNTEKFLNKFDIVISQNYIVDINVNYKKTKHSPLFIELFHGTLAKYPANFLWKKNTVIDYIVSPNPWTTQVFKDIGYKDSEILKFGYPRNNYYLNLNNKKIKNKLYKKYKINIYKKIVLYAPTWLKTNLKNNKKNEILNINLDNVIKKLDKNEVLLVWPHKNTSNLTRNIYYKFDKKYNDKVFFKKKLDKRYGFEVMCAADKMITDYSSIIFDYANLYDHKNILFFWPDIDNKQNKSVKKWFKKRYSNWGKNSLWKINKKNFVFEKHFINYDSKSKDANIKMYLFLKKIINDKNTYK